MRTSMFFILVLSLAVCVRAASLEPPLAHRVPVVSAASIGRRQVSIGSVSSVPSECTSTCSPVNDEISLGCPVTACCTTTFETQYYNCLECVGMALDATSYATAQNNLNLLYTTCVDMGFVLPRLALPGQAASGSNSSASAGTYATSTGSGVPSAPVTGSNGVTPSSPSKQTTGAAISCRWRGVRAEVLIGASVLLGVAGLW